MSDLMYLDVEDKVEDRILSGLELKSLGLEAWIVTPLVGYQVAQTEKLTIDLVAGARYLWIEVPLDFRFSAPLPPWAEQDLRIRQQLGRRGRYQGSMELQ